MEIDEITDIVVGQAIQIHRELGPGLLESVYEVVLADALEMLGLKVDRQLPFDIQYRDRRFAAAYRIDLLVEKCVILEIKSVECLLKAHAKQLHTYLRLAGKPVGLLLNFSGATMKEGIKRIVNDYRPPLSSSASPRLRVNQTKEQ